MSERKKQDCAFFFFLFCGGEIIRSLCLEVLCAFCCCQSTQCMWLCRRPENWFAFDWPQEDFLWNRRQAGQPQSFSCHHNMFFTTLLWMLLKPGQLACLFLCWPTTWVSFSGSEIFATRTNRNQPTIRPLKKRREYFRIFGQPFPEDFISFWKKKREKKK